jgi:hypothetical protein
VQWKRRKLSNLDTGTGEWTAAPFFTEIDTAFRWGFQDPREFYKLPMWTKAVMIAYCGTKDKMEAWSEKKASE